MDISPQITQWIPSQFPAFYESSGPNFIAFVQAYYEWLHTTGNPGAYSRAFLDTMDIDKTAEQFIQYFKSEFMDNLPKAFESDPRFLLKHILDLYRSKGTPRGYELLFRLIFDENIQLYIPGDYIFKPDDNEWVIKSYIEVSDSPYLAQLVGKEIVSSGNQETALVEEYNIVTLNNKVINVLVISHIEGVFNYSDYVLCPTIPAISVKNGTAPQVVGSLSAFSIDNGGLGFTVGQIVNITGSGGGAVGRVAAITAENGKVNFVLLDGGDGFTLNAIVTVTGGGGVGATFSVGSIVDPQAYLLNLDVINGYYNTQLDIASEGFSLHFTNLHSTFSLGEVVQSNINAVAVDFAYLSNTALDVGEVFSNTARNIAGLTVEATDPSFINFVGPQADLINANLVSGSILVGSITGAVVYVNSVYPVTNYLAQGNVVTQNTTVLVVDAANGYFLPTSNIVGLTSAANAYLNTTIRLTNWTFPGSIANSNLDSLIENTLTYETLIAGKIATLSNINPGQGYANNPVVAVSEPLIYQLQIPDGSGGFLGGDANVAGYALDANGIATAVQIIASGYGFTPGEPLSGTVSNSNVGIAGTAVVDQQGVTEGYWRSNKSFTDDTMYITDDYYYQNFAYEIIAPRMINTYSTFVNLLMHPVGHIMFGRYGVEDKQVTTAVLATDTLLASNVSLFINDYYWTGF